MEYRASVSEDDVSEIVRLSLQESLSSNLATIGNNPNDYEKGLIAGLFAALDYYSTQEQLEAFADEESEALDEFDKSLLIQDGNISNMETVEESDGSWTVSFDVDDETRDHLAAKGTEYAILMSILGNPSPVDVIRWAERGKQEENTDGIMNRYHEAMAEAYSK